MNELEDLAEEIIQELNDIGRDVDTYDYGLPIYDEGGMAKMKLAVMKVLERVKGGV